MGALALCYEFKKKTGSLGGKMKLPPTHCFVFIFFGMVSLTLIVWALIYYF